jgi:hypothetical protein
MGRRGITAPLQMSHLTERDVEIEREETKSFVNETTRTASFQEGADGVTDGYCGGHTPVRTLNGKVEPLKLCRVDSF